MQLLDHMSEWLMDRLLKRTFEKSHEDYLALSLHFLLTWAGYGSFAKNGSAALACARIHDAICAFSIDASYQRVNATVAFVCVHIPLNWFIV